MSTIPVPDRVVFLNIKDGNAFFDCTPQEARLAVKAVKDIRANGVMELDVYRELAKNIAEARKNMEKRSPDSIHSLECSAVTAHHVSDFFRMIEEDGVTVSHIFMGVRQHADLRKWERDAFELETDVNKMHMGLYGTMWGAHIIIKGIPDGKMYFVSDDPDKFRIIEVNVTYDGKEHRPHQMPIKDAMEQLLAKVNKIEEHLKIG